MAKMRARAGPESRARSCGSFSFPFPLSLSLSLASLFCRPEDSVLVRTRPSTVLLLEDKRMSWDSYIDNLLAQTKDAGGGLHADKACIIGLDGGAPWTTATHANALNVSWDGVKCMRSSVNEKGLLGCCLSLYVYAYCRVCLGHSTLLPLLRAPPSPPPQLQGQEGANIARCFKSRDFSSFMTSGVRAGNIKYQFLREEDKKVVYAKKKGEGALTLQASKTAIVIAHCPEGAQQGNLNKGVAVIAEYLESMNM